MGTDRSAGVDPESLFLAGLFVMAITASQVTASKIVRLDIPVDLPVYGGEILVPAAVFAYALTFFVSDCYAEIYGRRAAAMLVNVGFVMNIVFLSIVWAAIYAPVSPDSPVSQGSFSEVLGAGTGVVFGGMTAYIVSQNLDVVIFHRLKKATGGDALWLRNVLSTAASQLVDTTIFITVAFVVFQGVSVGTGVSLLAGQYGFKLLLVVLDTPLVYTVVGLVGETETDVTG